MAAEDQLLVYEVTTLQHHIRIQQLSDEVSARIKKRIVNTTPGSPLYTLLSVVLLLLDHTPKRYRGAFLKLQELRPGLCVYYVELGMLLFAQYAIRYQRIRSQRDVRLLTPEQTEGLWRWFANNPISKWSADQQVHDAALIGRYRLAVAVARTEASD